MIFINLDFSEWTHNLDCYPSKDGQVPSKDGQVPSKIRNGQRIITKKSYLCTYAKQLYQHKNSAGITI